MKVLVTGASGFVGSAVVNELAARPGFQVVATSRRPVQSSSPNIHWMVVGELGPGTSWREALRGVQMVVHCAGASAAHGSSFGDESGLLSSINAEGTENLAWQAAAAGVARFLYISTLKVHGETGGPFTENCPVNPQTHYARSKLDAERRLKEVCRTGAMEYVIIRPPLVYGPGVAGNFRLLQKWACSSWPLLPWQLNNQRSMVYVGNLARLVSLVLEHPAAANGTFLVTDGQDLSTAQVLKELRKLCTGSAGGRSLPLSVLRLASMLPGMKRIVARLSESLQASDAKARYLLGWSPPYSALEGFRQTVEFEKNVIGPGR